jgi:hypothetical protein
VSINQSANLLPALYPANAAHDLQNPSQISITALKTSTKPGIKPSNNTVRIMPVLAETISHKECGLSPLGCGIQCAKLALACKLYFVKISI